MTNLRNVTQLFGLATLLHGFINDKLQLYLYIHLKEPLGRGVSAPEIIAQTTLPIP
jgi:hypothetical protein